MDTTRIGQYDVIDELPPGSTGRAFLVDSATGERVVRVLDAPQILSTPFLTMLEAERGSALAYRHTFSARIHEIDVRPDRVQIVSEMVDGMPLSSLLARVRAMGEHLPWDVVVSFGVQLAWALQAAHARPWQAETSDGLYHGRICPDQVFVTYDGYARILGVGLGRSRRCLPPSRQSLPYLAPELWEAQRLSALADIYGLGVLLFDTLRAKRTFKRDTVEEVRHAVAVEELPSLRTERSDIPRSVEDVLRAMTHKVPSDRPRDIGAVSALLKGCLPDHDGLYPPRLAAVMQEHFADRVEMSRRDRCRLRRRLGVSGATGGPPTLPTGGAGASSEDLTDLIDRLSPSRRISEEAAPTPSEPTLSPLSSHALPVAVRSASLSSLDDSDGDGDVDRLVNAIVEAGQSAKPRPKGPPSRAHMTATATIFAQPRGQEPAVAHTPPVAISPPSDTVVPRARPPSATPLPASAILPEARPAQIPRDRTPSSGMDQVSARTPSSGVDRIPSPPSGVDRISSPPSGVDRVSNLSPPSGVERVRALSPPRGVDRVSNLSPPSGVDRAPSPASGVQRVGPPPRLPTPPSAVVKLPPFPAPAATPHPGLTSSDVLAPVEADTEVGALISDRYQILDVLGQGAAAIVYRAEHVHLKKSFAVKILRPELSLFPSVVERFRREARAVSQLDHPNVVWVSDFGQTDNGSLFLVMPLIDGVTLERLLHQGGPLDAQDAIHIAISALAGLEYAHERGLVHRDLKPDNIMIENEGDRLQAKLLDFGIAKTAESPVGLRITQTGMVPGTPAYMAPEQAAGEPVDARSDLYALGVVLYESLSGRLPFVAKSMVELLTKVMGEEPAPLDLGKHAGVRTGQLIAVVGRAMQKSGEDRFQSAREFSDALRACLIGP